MRQTYTNIEMILVDDGSTDRCPQICDTFAETDKRISVIHKTNGGLSDARNTGLSVAKGEYIAFVDSDDWVSSDFLKTMVNAICDNKADIVECNYNSVTKEPGENIQQKLNTRIYNAQEALMLLIADQILHQTVWNKLYKCEIIQDVKFPVGKCNEDEFWTYRVFGKARRIAKIDCQLYYYFQNPSSIMRKKYSLARLDAVEAKVIRQQYIEDFFPALSNLAATNLLGTIIFSGQMALRYLDDSELEKAFTILNRVINENFINHRYRFDDTFIHIIWYEVAKRNLLMV